MTLPLADLLVVDLTQVVSGPVCTMLMSDLGARVVKVEPPSGDTYRTAGHPLGPSGESNVNFLRFSRGKESVCLDLKTPEGCAVLERLLAGADVLVENFRPGVLARLGFSPERLRRDFPALVYTTVTGFGADDLYDSPYRDRPAYALVAEAMGGLLHLAGSADGPPVWMGFAMADITAGLLALSGTLAALRDRDRTGQGRRVDISMLDGALLMNDLPLAYHGAVGGVMGRGGYSLQSPWGPYPTSDGYVAVAVISDAQWRALCDVIGRPDLAARPDLATGRDRAARHDDVVAPALSAWTTSRTKEEATHALCARSVPAAPVNTASDLVDDPAVRAREMLVEVDDPVAGPVRVVGNPLKLDGVPAPAGRRVPRLGEHTEQVLTGLLGMSPSEVTAVTAGTFPR